MASQREPILEQTRKDFESGIISANEARLARRYDPIDGGDELLVPAGKLPIDFNPGDLSDNQFKAWMNREGISNEIVEKIISLSKK